MSERISLQEPLKVARYYYDLSEKAEWPETPYLRVILHSILRHLESQMNIPARTTSATPDASEEQPATTASPTTAGRSDVLDSPTARMMPLSLRLHCALTEAERTAVVNDLRLSALWDEFTGRLSMHVLAVESATSISQKLASSPSVETSTEAAATSPSEPESEQCEARGTIGRCDGLRCSRESGHKGSHWTHDGIMFPSVPGSEE